MYGLCSSWLCDLREGTLLIGVRRGEFSPINEDPLVFVGPGTGVAPARAFALSQPSDMLLFFGCRHETKDRLYADEFAGVWRNWKSMSRSLDIRTLVRDGT